MPINALQFQPGLSLPRFQALYGTEQQCESALFAAHWPHGWSCAHCACKRFFLTRNGAGRQLWECFVSGYQSSSIVGIRESMELERDLATQQARYQEAQAALREAEQTRSAYLAETRRALSERQAQADLKRHQTSQELAKATQREQLATLTAPVAGTVQQLALHTEGGVVTEAQVLMVIVPDAASVSAEVTLENKDIGFVTPGQDVAIKLETFPFTRLRYSESQRGQGHAGRGE